MEPAFIAQILASGFFAVLFLQSGFDKVSDRKGNLEWLTGHFANSPLAKMVPFMLTFITMVELAAGAVCAVGAVMLVLRRGPETAVVGLGLSGLALLMLFFGQRMAKDYPGAATLATYFGVMLLGLLMMQY
ncbi:MAG: hypothetical protein IT363_06900 [Methanoregulaceae archaeon]|nr:hypothetical protein [Methanoregulaceae archaeon]